MPKVLVVEDSDVGRNAVTNTLKTRGYVVSSVPDAASMRALIDTDRADMWIVGVLVLMFSIVFPILKLCSSSFYLFNRGFIRRNPIVRFFALEPSGASCQTSWRS